MSTKGKSAEAGLYKQGDTSVKSSVTQTSARVRPMTPFSTTSKSFGKYAAIPFSLLLSKYVDKIILCLVVLTCEKWHVDTKRCLYIIQG